MGIPTKRCRVCKEYKPLEEFPNNRCRKDGKGVECKKCNCDRAKDYRMKHPEWKAEYDKKYREGHREICTRHMRKYRERNRELLLSKKRKWYKDHPECLTAQSRRRNEKVARMKGSHTSNEWKRLCSHFENICLCCGTSEKLEKDHVVSVENGGSDYIANIQPLCKSCNSKKWTNTIDYRNPDMLRDFLEKEELLKACQ